MLELIVDPPVRPALRGRLAPLRRTIARMVRAASLHEGRGADLEVVLRFTDDAAMRELNRTWRAKDRPTDVLAFAMREGESGALAGPVLGDVVISVETAARQARRGLEREIVHLAAHGLCHLLGYDHQDDEEERLMEARVRDLLRQGRSIGRVVAA